LGAPELPHVHECERTAAGRLALMLQLRAHVQEWEDDAAFTAAMEVHGVVERCFVMRNPKGESKVRDRHGALGTPRNIPSTIGYLHPIWHEQ
jgi:hypothetical protein